MALILGYCINTYYANQKVSWSLLYFTTGIVIYVNPEPEDVIYSLKKKKKKNLQYLKNDLLNQLAKWVVEITF